MHRFLNFVFAWCVERVQPDKMEEWMFNLDAPLPGDEKKAPSQEDLAADGQAFLAMFNSKG